MAHPLPRALFPLALLALVGCKQFSGLFSDDEAAEPTTTAEPAAPTTATGVQPGQGTWRALIILDTTADRSFFVPEQAIQKTLADADIEVVRAYALGPVEVKDETGKVLGTVDLKTLTDQGKGYVLAEEGRPADFVAPSSLPFLLQQASAYYGKQIRMNNGRAAGASAGPAGGVGARARSAEGGKPQIPEAIRKQMKAQKGAKLGKVAKTEGAEGKAGAEAGAAE